MYDHLWVLWQTSSLRGRMSHKKRESDEHKRQEAERQKAQTPSRTPQDWDKGGKGGSKGGGNRGKPKSQRRSSAGAISPSPADVDPKKRPQGDNASPEGTNSKKRGLAWMAQSLMAAGVDVNSLPRSTGAALKGRTWFSASS